jgi:sulfite exporter TauE/SafE
VFIGALAGVAGAMVLHGAAGWGGGMQRLLALVSGALLVMVALQFFGYRGRVRLGRAAPLADAFAAALRQIARAPGPAAPLALGVVNGFLPCPLVYAFAVQAAAAAALTPGMAIMAAFGLGTFPAMLLMGFGGAFFGPRMRQAWVAGTFFLALGVITLGRAVLWMPGHEAHL